MALKMMDHHAPVIRLWLREAGTKDRYHFKQGREPFSLTAQSLVAIPGKSGAL